MCLVEAMKSGSVPVVFDLPTGIHDIIDHNVNGYIFTQGDIANIVNQIELLDRDRKLLESRSKEAMAKSQFDVLAQNSNLRIRKDYSWNGIQSK